MQKSSRTLPNCVENPLEMLIYSIVTPLSRPEFHDLCRLVVTARVISGVASHIQVEETEALHVSRIALQGNRMKVFLV